MFSDNNTLVEEYKKLIETEINKLGERAEVRIKLKEILNNYITDYSLETEKAINERDTLRRLLDNEKQAIIGEINK